MVRLSSFAHPLFPLHVLDELAVARAARRAELPLEVFARDDGLLVRALLPGVDPASIDVELVEQSLRIRARRPTDEPEGVRVLSRELPAGPVDVALALPFRPAADGVTARYELGVLTLELPRPAEERPRRIAVESR